MFDEEDVDNEVENAAAVVQSAGAEDEEEDDDDEEEEDMYDWPTSSTPHIMLTHSSYTVEKIVSHEWAVSQISTLFTRPQRANNDAARWYPDIPSQMAGIQQSFGPNMGARDEPVSAPREYCTNVH